MAFQNEAIPSTAAIASEELPCSRPLEKRLNTEGSPISACHTCTQRERKTNMQRQATAVDNNNIILMSANNHFQQPNTDANKNRGHDPYFHGQRK